jgi:hypothetical protein
MHHNDWHLKPWATPIQYSEPGNQAGATETERTPEEIDALIARSGNERPAGPSLDNTPINYRRGDPNAVIDVDDEDELPVPDKYVPASKLEHGGEYMPPVAEVIDAMVVPTKAPRPEKPATHWAASAPRATLSPTLESIHVVPEGVVIDFVFDGTSYRCGVAELGRMADLFSHWTRIAIQLTT